MDRTLRYCGRTFTESEIETIRTLIVDTPGAHRFLLSKLVCEKLGWCRANGQLKDMSCRVAMLRMQEHGLIQLPAPQTRNGNGRPYRCRRTPQAEPELMPTVVPVSNLPDLHLEIVADQKSSYLWNEYIDRYHYLGYYPLPGAQLRYFACAKGRIFALLGFSAAAWKTAPRDRFIGWTPEQRKSKLHLVVDNSRFLILPWIHSHNLASRLLAMATRRLVDDWHARYGYRPVLVETFVEIRFRGTCYKAANWICLGETQGRGKLDKTHKARLPKKSIWVYPLIKNFRRQLLH